MYDSVALPVKDENSVLDNSHRDSFERVVSRHKVKTAVAILFVVVVALVGLSNSQTKTASQTSTAAYLEAENAIIQEGQQVLTTYAIKGVDSGAYITHSLNTWNINSNIGIFGTAALTAEEQWDLHYFDEVEEGQTVRYYKVKHSHDTAHWLTLQGAPYYNPTVLQAPKTIYDGPDGYIRWQVTANADGSAPETGAPPTGPGNVYYLVNVNRDRCLAIRTAVANPKTATYNQLQDSVTSFAKVGTDFPAACKIVFIDASNV